MLSTEKSKSLKERVSSADDLESVIHELLQVTSDNPSIYNQTVMIASRFRNFQLQRIHSLSPHGEIKIERAAIVEAIIHIIDQATNLGKSKKENRYVSQLSLLSIWLTVIWAGLSLQNYLTHPIPFGVIPIAFTAALATWVVTAYEFFDSINASPIIKLLGGLLIVTLWFLAHWVL